MADVPWRPSRSATILLGLLTLWPFLYGALFVLSVAFFWFKATGTGGAAGPGLFPYLFPLHCATMLLILALTGVYVFHAYKTDRIAADKKVLWVVILLLGNMIALPFYWYLYVWRDVQPDVQGDVRSDVQREP